MVTELQSVRSFGVIVLLLLVGAATSVAAQSTAFTYQGKLADNGNLANGTYDFQFMLYDTQTIGSGTQQGTTQTVTNLTVSNGIFTVMLDFGVCASCFNGAARFLELAVRPSGGGTFTTLGPRQPITATPYAINAAQLGGLAASNFLQNSTSQQASSNFNISGNGTAGGTLSGNIVNATTQFNLGGQRLLSAAGFNNLFAGFNAGTNNSGSSNTFFGANAGEQNTTGNGNSFFGEFSGGLNTIGASNSFFGSGAGYSNTGGNANSFFGQQAGNSNSTGSNNAFFGTQAGLANTTGSFNTFFGSRAGQATTTGSNNAFFGERAGQANTTGNNNAFIGDYAGSVNTTGFLNTFVGTQAGSLNTTGSNNAFFGYNAGRNLVSSDGNTFIGTFADFSTSNPTGSNNTLLGYQTRVNTGITNSTAIGANAMVTQSNSLVLGGITGTNGGTSVNVGIGTSAPQSKLHISDTSLNATTLFLENTSSPGPFFMLNYGSTGGGVFWTGLDSANTTAILTTKPLVLGANGGLIFSGSNGGEHMRITTSGRVGIGITNPQFKLHVDGGSDTGVFSQSTNGVGVLGLSTTNYGVYGSSQNSYAGYFNGNVFVVGTVTQGSDARLKQNISPVGYGLAEVLRLRPVTWRWRDHPERGTQLGLVAQEVEPLLPELVSTAKDAEQTKGLNYTGLLPVLINAIQEQQQQIDQLQTHIQEQKAEIENLQQELRHVKQQKEVIRQQQQEMAAVKQLLCASHPKANICKAKSLK